MKELDYALENTALNKTPGPDGIHGQMISNLGKNGKERLLDIFNNSWKTGKLPQDWKSATIIPIKKLDKSADDPKNYQPISLTSICCKLMETIILRRLTYPLDTRNLLPEEQYGFRKGHGTIDQLFIFHTKDLTQAFDKVWKNKLITKLYKYFKIDGKAITWINDFLKIDISGSNIMELYLKPSNCTKDLPQGAVLSPTLFTLFIAGIEEKISHKTNTGLYEADIMPLKNRRSYNLPKYINKIKNKLGHTGSGCLIKTTNGIEKINRRNPDFCSVFRSELIAIYEALKSIRNTNYQDIWILTDSRSAIQHLSHTGELRDKISRNIIGYLQKLSKTSKIHLQWIPSHVGIEGNEAADVLAKKGTKEPLPQKNKLTFKEIETVAKTKISKNWRIPPKHSWYSGVNPGGALNIRNRQHQTTLTRFRTDHLKPLKIENNNKIYPTCPKCSLAPAAPEHILACIRCTKQDLWERPLLIIKQLKEHGLMKFVRKSHREEELLSIAVPHHVLGVRGDTTSPAAHHNASETNLKSLERIQLSAARIITGLRNTCPNDIVLYEADIMPLKDRRSYNLSKYINKIKSYGNKHRTSKYILNWESNLRLKKEGPLHLAKRNGFLKYKVEKIKGPSSELYAGAAGWKAHFGKVMVFPENLRVFRYPVGNIEIAACSALGSALDWRVYAREERLPKGVCRVLVTHSFWKTSMRELSLMEREKRNSQICTDVPHCSQSTQ
ncbi:hypothetical protein LAZ67_20000127 [Cordylochernes scorpioides]|uniref:RNase H type-1 domain-containing protein n=1 Tax=Cordylochernes scorpioides TaxID=51811 RepID=A0ABY6LIY0_9ARAC|nr:hypothetical protein LAZ67_20000127 [Cordylochernes scorpioides]